MQKSKSRLQNCENRSPNLWFGLRRTGDLGDSGYATACGGEDARIVGKGARLGSTQI